MIEQKQSNINKQIAKHLLVVVKYRERIINLTDEEELKNAENSDSVKSMYIFWSLIKDSDHIQNLDHT